MNKLEIFNVGLGFQVWIKNANDWRYIKRVNVRETWRKAKLSDRLKSINNSKRYKNMTQSEFTSFEQLQLVAQVRLNNNPDDELIKADYVSITNAYLVMCEAYPEFMADKLKGQRL
jgi:hypothetical protein